MPGAIQAGLRQLFGSAAAGPDNASVSPVASTSSRTLTIGADCQDKAISSSRALSLRSLLYRDRSRPTRSFGEVQWVVSWLRVA